MANGWLACPSREREGGGFHLLYLTLPYFFYVIYIYTLNLGLHRLPALSLIESSRLARGYDSIWGVCRVLWKKEDNKKSQDRRNFREEEIIQGKVR